MSIACFARRHLCTVWSISQVTAELPRDHSLSGLSVRKHKCHETDASDAVFVWSVGKTFHRRYPIDSMQNDSKSKYRYLLVFVGICCVGCVLSRCRVHRSFSVSETVETLCVTTVVSGGRWGALGEAWRSVSSGSERCHAVGGTQWPGGAGGACHQKVGRFGSLANLQIC